MKNLVFIALVLIPVFYGGESLHALVLKDIEIGGDIKKTKDETVLNIIQYEIGNEIGSSDLPLIEQRLIKSGIFINEETRIDLIEEEDQAVLVLTLADKFSFVPIPIVKGGEETKAGLFLMDNNLFGTADTLFLGGIFGKDDILFMSNYTNTLVNGSNMDLGAGFFYIKEESEISDASGDRLAERDQESISAQVFSTWHLGQWNLTPTFSLGSVEYDSYDHLTTYSSKFAFNYNNLFWGSFFPEGLNWDGEYSATLYSDEFGLKQESKAKLSWDKNLTDRLHMTLGGRGMWFDGDEILSSQVVSSILPASVYADVNMEASATLNIALMDFSWGFISLPLAFHVGYFDGISGSNELYYGPSAELNLNLKKIAMPAISLKYGWNMETTTPVIQANVGF